jgi:hypothetical protein
MRHSKYDLVCEVCLKSYSPRKNEQRTTLDARVLGFVKVCPSCLAITKSDNRHYFKKWPATAKKIIGENIAICAAGVFGISICGNTYRPYPTVNGVKVKNWHLCPRCRDARSSEDFGTALLVGIIALTLLGAIIVMIFFHN